MNNISVFFFKAAITKKNEGLENKLVLQKNSERMNHI